MLLMRPSPPSSSWITGTCASSCLWVEGQRGGSALASAPCAHGRAPHAPGAPPQWRGSLRAWKESPVESMRTRMNSKYWSMDQRDSTAWSLYETKKLRAAGVRTLYEKASLGAAGLGR